MFDDERITITCGKIFRKGILIATIWNGKINVDTKKVSTFLLYDILYKRRWFYGKNKRW